MPDDLSVDLSVEVLTGAHTSEVIALCRAALDLPEDATEAGWIVRRLAVTWR